MFVLSNRLRIRIEISYSLKDKRQVVRSIKDKFRAAFKVPLVEVSDLNNKNFATLGSAFVCEDLFYGRQLQQRMVEFILDNCHEEVIDVEKFEEKY